MQNLITRMSMLVIAFGFFISCSKAYESVLTSDQLDYSSSELFDQAAEIRTGDPENPQADYLEGLAYSKIARSKNPVDRYNDYTLMKERFGAAVSRQNPDRATSSLMDAIENTVESVWSYEHNSAAGIISSDSTRTTQQLQTALSHAKNAVLVEPDSLISYELMADTYALLGETEDAIQTLLLADTLLKPASQRIHEHIAYLYLNTGNAEEAVKWYESALRWQQSRTNIIEESGDLPLQQGSLINTWHGLVNAYIAAGNYENAIGSLEKLLEMSPLNDSYKSVLAAQLITRITSEFESTDSPDRGVIVNSIDKLNSIVKSNPTTMLSVATNLTSVATSRVESKLADDESYSAAEDLDVMLICEAAINLYQEILSVDSTNTTAIAGLADTYLVLGNEEEASKWFELLN